MTARNVLQQHFDGSEWIEIHPVTKAENVISTVDGKSVATHIADYVKHPGYGTTTGVANAYLLFLTPAPVSYVDGMCVVIKINVASTGASTLNVNSLGAKALKKSDGSNVTNLKVNGIYTFRYNATSSAFIVQGEGGEFGTATSADVLAGKTIPTESGLVTGTMADRGTINITPTGSNQTIAAGKHSGSGIVYGVSVPSAKVLNDTTIAGTRGTMPSVTQNINPTSSNIPITAGYHNGTGVVQGVSVPAERVLVNTNIAGVNGTLPIVTRNISPQTYNVAIPAGYHDGSGVVYGYTPGRRSASGVGSLPAGEPYKFTVTGLGFTPNILLIYWEDGTRYQLSFTNGLWAQVAWWDRNTSNGQKDINNTNLLLSSVYAGGFTTYVVFATTSALHWTAIE